MHIQWVCKHLHAGILSVLLTGTSEVAVSHVVAEPGLVLHLMVPAARMLPNILMDLAAAMDLLSQYWPGSHLWKFSEDKQNKNFGCK